MLKFKLTYDIDAIPAALKTAIVNKTIDMLVRTVINEIDAMEMQRIEDVPCDPEE